MNDADVEWFNKLTSKEVTETLRGCCGSEAWCQAMIRRRPISNVAHLHQLADAALDELDAQDWQQAFECHPQIGDLASLRMKFAGNKEWSASEQSGMATANDQILSALAEGNAAYQAKFGYIFIVCATGKSAMELLSILQLRLPLDPATEFHNAAAEQRKITHLRIDKIKRVVP